MRFLILNASATDSIQSPVDDWVGNEVHSENLRKLGHDALELSADTADLAVRIKRYGPDVLLNHAMRLGGAFLRDVRPYVRVLAGFHSFPLPANFDFGAYHLMLSPIDNVV